MSYGSIGRAGNALGEELANDDRYHGALFTIRNNIKGWYCYSFSSEPFVVSAVATYMPLLLEQFARISGVTLDDHNVKCSTAHEKCVLGLFGSKLYVDTSSFALYTFSLSVLAQAIVVITVSGVVDVWKTVKVKKRILVLFSVLGSLSTIMISQLYATQFYFLAVLCIFSNACYGVVSVVGNSLLPVFVRDSIHHDKSLQSENIDSLTAIISGRGASLGYSSALIVQIISVWLVHNSKSKEDIQVATLFVGAWWLIWQSPMIWLLKDVELPHNAEANTNNLQSMSIFSYGWTSLFRAFKRARLLRDVIIFLIGWFIVSDAITTINSAAILFSKTELNMSTLSLILISIITMLSAMLGAFAIPQFMSEKFHLTSQQLLLYIIVWASIIPVYGIMGFIFENVGLKHDFEMFLTAIWYGISLGGLSAVSRSVFSLIIPRGKESTFFSLFSITDKGSSILGPFLIGLITDKTHNIRYSFFLLFLFLMLSLPVFNALDVERGKKEAQDLTTDS